MGAYVKFFEDLQDDQKPSFWVGQEMVDDGGHGTKGEEDSIRNQAKIKTGKAPKYHQKLYSGLYILTSIWVLPTPNAG